jgi:hypothetical protein
MTSTLDDYRGAFNLLYLSQKRVNASTAKRGYSEEHWLANYLENGFFVSTDKKGKVDVTNETVNIQLKKSKVGQFQQVARGTVDNLITKVPELVTIEEQLKDRCVHKKLFDASVLRSLNENKRKIIEHALLGYDKKPDILCISEWNKKDTRREKLQFMPMKNVVESLMEYDFKLRKSGTVIELGPSFTIQRKGGDGGRVSANDIQFKIVPSRLNVEDLLTIPQEH